MTVAESLTGVFVFAAKPEPPRDRGGKFIDRAGETQRQQELERSIPKGPAK